MLSMVHMKIDWTVLVLLTILAGNGNVFNISIRITFIGNGAKSTFVNFNATTAQLFDKKLIFCPILHASHINLHFPSTEFLLQRQNILLNTYFLS